MPSNKSPQNTPADSHDEQNTNTYDSCENHDQNVEELEELQQQSDSGGSVAAPGDEEGYIVVHLPDIRKELQCPICLGILKKTRAVMECLHRFCGECIDKSMRMGKKECPACRTHIASRRSLRDDTKYDKLIAALYPDVEKYDEEESALQEEERAHNEQIQASISQTAQRQSEARGKKRKKALKC